MITKGTLKVRLLGGCRLTRDGAPVLSLAQARLQFLLAYLLLHRDAPISRQQLAFAFWPDTSDEQARGNLRTLLHRLLEALPDNSESLVIDRHTIQWRAEATVELDVDDFEAALARAKLADQAGDRAAARRWLEAALSAYTGDLLPDCYDDWILPIRERLTQGALRATERLILLLDDAQAYAAAEDHAQRMLHHDPLDESNYRQIMRLQALRGDRVGVVRTFNKIKRRLDDKWGIANSLDSLGVITRRLGDPVRARACFAESLMLYRDLGSNWGLSEVFDHLAGLLADTSLYRPAAQLMAAAAAMSEAIHGTIPPVARDDYERQLAGIRTRLGDEEFRAAWTLGRALTTEQAVRRALELTAL